MEKIEAFVETPWVLLVQVNIFDREDAIEKAKSFHPGDPVLFTDATIRNNVVGIGVKWMGKLYWPDISRTIATSEHLDPYAAKLIALDAAVSHLLNSPQRLGTRSPITIISDCKSAFQALGNPYPKSGQFLITQITFKYTKLTCFDSHKTISNGAPAIQIFHAMIKLVN